MELSLYHDTYPAGSQQAGAEGPEEIVLLHGWGMNSLVWDELIPLLNEKYTITLIDLPGLGRSPMPGGEYTLDYLVEHVCKVAPSKAIWIGWSLGGLVVQRVCELSPERVSAAVVIAGTPRFVAGESWQKAMSEGVFQKFFEHFQMSNYFHF